MGINMSVACDNSISTAEIHQMLSIIKLYHGEILLCNRCAGDPIPMHISPKSETTDSGVTELIVIKKFEIGTIRRVV
jgi:hypothetical protein